MTVTFSAKIHLIEGFPYGGTTSSFPVAIALTSNEDCEVSAKIDVRELTLTEKGSTEEVFWGRLARGAIGRMDCVLYLAKGRPHWMIYDLLYTENEDAIPAGEFVLKIFLELHLREGKSWVPVTVENQRELQIQ